MKKENLEELIEDTIHMTCTKIKCVMCDETDEIYLDREQNLYYCLCCLREVLFDEYNDD